MSLCPSCQEVWQQAGRHDVGAATESSHLDRQTQGRRSWLKMALPQWPPPTTKPHPLILPKHFPWLGINYSNIWAYGCYSHLNHHVLVNDHFYSIKSATMSMEDLYVVGSSSVSFFIISKFHPTGLLFPWVSLFLGFKKKKKLSWMGLLSWQIYNLSIGNLLIFAIWSCILLLT